MTLENGTYEGLFLTFLLPDWTDVLILPIAFYRKAVGAGAAAKVAEEFVRRTTARITLHPTDLAKVCVTDLAATAVGELRAPPNLHTLALAAFGSGSTVEKR